MSGVSKLLLLLALSLPCIGNEPAPHSQEKRVLNQIAATASSRSESAVAALELLKQVAMGLTAEMSPESAMQFGIPSAQLRNTKFDHPSVRAYAFRKIGGTGLPAAANFLQNLKPSDIGRDDTGSIWPAAQIALHEAMLSRITGPSLKTQFLENTLTERHDAASNGAVKYWAVEELCDSGAQASMALIQESIRDFWSGERGEEAVRFCEARIDVLSRHSDRVKAMGSVLTVQNNADNARLITWAMHQLQAIHSPEADAELKRFAGEIDRLPNGSVEQGRFYEVKQVLQRILADERTP